MLVDTYGFRLPVAVPVLSWELEDQIPDRMNIGRGNYLVIRGTVRTTAKLDRLYVEVNSQRITATSVAPLSLRLEGGQRIFRYRFLVLLPLEPGILNISLVGYPAVGGETCSFIKSVEVVEPAGYEPRAVNWPASGPKVAICMAAYNPSPKLLQRQIQSIIDQEHKNWICIITDDSTNPGSRDDILDLIEHDSRFIYVKNTERLGFYRNFERAMQLVPADADFIALADQDDRWYPEKLSILLSAIGSKGLVYSDCRLTDGDGQVLGESFWINGRRNNFTDLPTLMIANTVTGAASLFRRDLLDSILPLPQRVTDAFHDQWIALVARVSGGLAYVDRPLYDYTQHGSNVIGHKVNSAPGIKAYMREVIRHRRAAPTAFIQTLGEGEKNFAWNVRISLLAKTLLTRSSPSAPDKAVLRSFSRFYSTVRVPLGQKITAALKRRCSYNIEGMMLHAALSVRLLSFYAARFG